MPTPGCPLKKATPSGWASVVAQAHEPGGGARPKPLLIAVDDEPDPLSSLERELRKRYGEDYEVMCFPEPAPAVQTLEHFREAGLPVAGGAGRQLDARHDRRLAPRSSS